MKSEKTKEDEICTKISEKVRMAGFLEKKGKMKIVSPWKKYWFVLEERLLLNYKSQIEYINLSPCRGSLNMGLVSTVRPGSSSSHCVIHVITRTQAVQLRAKDRANQEEWLQALLDSMALPVPGLNGSQCLRHSIDSIPRAEQREKTKQSTLPHKLGKQPHKNKISGALYGGSLDTAIWMKRFKQVRTPSPNIPKGKMLEKVLAYVEEVDVSSEAETASLTQASSNSLETLERKDDLEEEGFSSLHSITSEPESKSSCKLHDENQNHDFRGRITSGAKKANQREEGIEQNQGSRSQESRLERFRSVITRKSNKEKAKPNDEGPKPRSVKKRKPSFLEKVFKKHYKRNERVEEEETDSDDPLYDTIGVRQQQREATVVEEPPMTLEPESLEDLPDPQPLYSQVQKPVFGSKVLLTEVAMYELKNKLKSRESLERQEIEVQKNKVEEVETELSEAFSKKAKRDTLRNDSPPTLPPRDASPIGSCSSTEAPLLPPRRSRQLSPPHDVPGNNSPVSHSRFNLDVCLRVPKMPKMAPDEQTVNNVNETKVQGPIETKTNTKENTESAEELKYEGKLTEELIVPDSDAPLRFNLDCCPRVPGGHKKQVETTAKDKSPGSQVASRPTSRTNQELLETDLDAPHPGYDRPPTFKSARKAKKPNKFEDLIVAAWGTALETKAPLDNSTQATPVTLQEYDLPASFKSKNVSETRLEPAQPTIPSRRSASPTTDYSRVPSEYDLPAGFKLDVCPRIPGLKKQKHVEEEEAPTEQSDSRVPPEYDLPAGFQLNCCPRIPGLKKKKLLLENEVTAEESKAQQQSILDARAPPDFELPAGFELNCCPRIPGLKKHKKAIENVLMSDEAPMETTELLSESGILPETGMVQDTKSKNAPEIVDGPINLQELLLREDCLNNEKSSSKILSQKYKQMENMAPTDEAPRESTECIISDSGIPMSFGNNDREDTGKQGEGMVTNGGRDSQAEELAILLAKLTKITTAPLPSISQKFSWSGQSANMSLDITVPKPSSRRASDPDYDMPRPHHSFGVIINNTDDDDDNASESSSSPSMEPDSLEAKCNDVDNLLVN